jgi:hypothetical protein
MVDSINGRERSRISDIAIDEFEIRIVQEVPDVLSLAAPEIVETHYAVVVRK